MQDVILLKLEIPKFPSAGRVDLVKKRKLNDSILRKSYLSAEQHPITITSKHTIALRTTVPADAALLTHWDNQPHVIASSPNDSIDWFAELEAQHDWQEFLLAELDGRPVGILQIIDPAIEETHYWGDVPHNLRAGDIWIGEAGDLGKGYGTEMMRLAIERCFLVPEVKAILIDPLASNAGARQFYERLGFHYVEDRMFDQDHCAVYRLNREDWEVKPF